MWTGLRRLGLVIILIWLTFAEAEQHSSRRRHRRRGRDRFTCVEEGYHNDPEDCGVYYRCVDWGDGRPLTVFTFECSEGTVFSKHKGNVCTFPADSGRPECENHGNKGTGIPTTATDITSTTELPEITESTTTRNLSTTTTQTSAITGQTASTGEGEIQCTQEGYLSDPNDCRKFYRCVDEGDGILIKYEFLCGLGTVWDPEITGCNHPWAVSRKDCKEGSSTTGAWTGHTGGPTESESTTSTAGHTETSGNSETPEKPGTPGSTGAPGTCLEEGFFPDVQDCRKFYRCVWNGSSFIKFEFQCGSGTAWDSVLESCNHEYLVPSCKKGSSPSVTTSTGNSIAGITSSPASSTVSTAHTGTSSGSSVCPGEGFFPNPNDCTKFFRCVRTENGYQRHDFSCAAGTAWDASIETCNHISQVPSCSSTNGQSSQGSTTPSSSSTWPATNTTTTPTSGTNATSTSTPPATNITLTTSTTTAPSNETDCTTKKPNNTIVCEKEGFYPDPTRCDKFYRCVDNGNGFNVYHFQCAPGTIFDPSISVCNYPDSVYPPRDCTMPTSSTSTTSETTTEQSTTTGRTEESTTESRETEGTTESTTTTSSSTESNGTTESTTESTTLSTSTAGTDTPTTESTSETSSATTETTTESTTETTTQSTTEATTQSTSEATTQTTSEATTQSTSEATTESTSEATTQSTSEATTESTSEATTESTSEATTESTSEATTESTTVTSTESTSEATTQSTTETTTESTSEATTQSTSEATTESTSEATTESTSEATTQSTTEATTESTSEATTQSATEATTESTSEATTQPTTEATTESTTILTTESTTTVATTVTTRKPTTTSPSPTVPATCPIGNLTDEQIALVCPTGFKRHPKYCNLFYQCTAEDDYMNIKVLVLSCPDGTIYDEKKVQCLPDSESSQPCTGTKAVGRFYRRLEQSSVSPVKVSSGILCPGEGHYPYQLGCNNAFYKCKRDSENNLQGYLYKCPPNFLYWSISRRCERATRLPMCAITALKNQWDKRWEIPEENLNVSARSLFLS